MHQGTNCVTIQPIESLLFQLIRQMTDQTVNEKVAIAICGIAKVYVGQIVETGMHQLPKSQFNDSAASVEVKTSSV